MTLMGIISGSRIVDRFKEIYACEFHYDENGIADWPKLAVNYTNKTQFLFRINKGVLDISDDYNLNKKMLEGDRRIPTSNMIYIGDGLTDIPCMKLTKESGGVSIAVYTDKNKKEAHGLLKDGRINFAVKADYSENEELDKIMKNIIDKIVIDTKLKNVTASQKDKETQKEEKLRGGKPKQGGQGQYNTEYGDKYKKPKRQPKRV